MYKLRYKEDDINLLLPSVRERVVGVISDMKDLGFQPVLKDTLRTSAEAAANELKGTGIRLSMHMFGVAADVICNQHGWSCQQRGCKFYKKLGYAVESRGLYWGGHFGDMVHMQGLPFTTAVQDALRALGRGPDSLDARDAFVRRYLKEVAAPSR